MSISQEIINIEKNPSEINKLLFIKNNFMAAVQEPGCDLDSLYLTVLNINKDNYQNYLSEKNIEKNCLSFSSILQNEYGYKTINYDSIWNLSANVLREVLLDNNIYINNGIWQDSTLIKSINTKNNNFIIFLKYFHNKALGAAEEHFTKTLEKEELSVADTKIILEALKEITSIRYKRAQVFDSVVSDTIDDFIKKMNDYSEFILNPSTKLEFFRLLMRAREGEKMRLFSEKFQITNIPDSRTYGSFTNELLNKSKNLKFIKKNVTPEQFNILTRDLYPLFVNELEANNKDTLSLLPEKYFYNIEAYFNVPNVSAHYSLFMSKIISSRYQEGTSDNLFLEIASTPAFAKAQQYAFFDLLKHPDLPVEVIEKYVKDNPNFSSYLFNRNILEKNLNRHKNSFPYEENKYYGGDNISAIEVLLTYNISSKFINYINKVEMQYLKEIVKIHTHKINFENLKKMLLADKIDIVEGTEFINFILNHCVMTYERVIANPQLAEFIVQLYMRDERLKKDQASLDNLMHRLPDSIKEKLKVLREHAQLHHDIHMSKNSSNNFKI